MLKVPLQELASLRPRFSEPPIRGPLIPAGGRLSKTQPRPEATGCVTLFFERGFRLFRSPHHCTWSGIKLTGTQRLNGMRNSDALPAIPTAPFHQELSGGQVELNQKRSTKLYDSGFLNSIRPLLKPKQKDYKSGEQREARPIRWATLIPHSLRSSQLREALRPCFKWAGYENNRREAPPCGKGARTVQSLPASLPGPQWVSYQTDAPRTSKDGFGLVPVEFVPVADC